MLLKYHICYIVVYHTVSYLFEEIIGSVVNNQGVIVNLSSFKKVTITDVYNVNQSLSK